MSQVRQNRLRRSWGGTAGAVALVGREARRVRDPGCPGPLRRGVLERETPERGIAPRGMRGMVLRALEAGEVPLDARLPAATRSVAGSYRCTRQDRCVRAWGGGNSVLEPGGGRLFLVHTSL